MTKGFGMAPTYKLVIVTAVGGATDLILPATSQKNAFKAATAILNLIVNPTAEFYSQRAQELGFGDSLEALQNIGEQMAGAALVADVHPAFAAKLAKRTAMVKKGGRSVIDGDRAEEVLGQIKPCHFLATLYAPNSRWLSQFSNLLQLDNFAGWGKV